MDNKDRVEEWKLVELYKYTKVIYVSDIYKEYIQSDECICVHSQQQYSSNQPNLTDCD